MKKLLVISVLITGTLASAGMATAADVTLGTYSDWALTSFDSGNR